MTRFSLVNFMELGRWTHQVVYKATEFAGVHTNYGGRNSLAFPVAIRLHISYPYDFIWPLFTSRAFPNPPNHVDEMQNPLTSHYSALRSPITSSSYGFCLCIICSIHFILVIRIVPFIESFYTSFTRSRRYTMRSRLCTI